jgi:hypothetical protein
MKGRARVAMLDASLMSLMLALSLSVFGQTQGKKSDAGNSPAAQNPFDRAQYFSAVMNGGLIEDKDRKIYRSGKLMRTDFPDQYRVTNISVPVTWVVFAKKDPKGATCARFDVADAGDYPFWGLKDFRVERSSATEPSAAKESVEGHACKIENLRFVNSHVNPAVTVEMKIWEAEDLKDFPVKTEVHDLTTDHRYTIRYSEVDLQPPDPKLFVHPEKCGGPGQKIQHGAQGANAAKPTSATSLIVAQPAPFSSLR